MSSSATAKEWMDTFEDVSIGYHKQQAKEKAQREGLVVEHGDMDVKLGDEDVTYASDVNETLIPYTTVEDSMHVYDVKHYVNDANRKHAQVLSEYDGHKKQHYDLRKFSDDIGEFTMSDNVSKGYRATLSDGTRIIARPYSSPSSNFLPTLEFQRKKFNGLRDIKVRYLP